MYLKRLVAHYVANNPVNFIDPTGHRLCIAGEQDCSEEDPRPGGPRPEAVTEAPKEDQEAKKQPTPGHGKVAHAALERGLLTPDYDREMKQRGWLGVNTSRGFWSCATVTTMTDPKTGDVFNYHLKGEPPAELNTWP